MTEPNSGEAPTPQAPAEQPAPPDKFAAAAARIAELRGGTPAPEPEAPPPEPTPEVPPEPAEPEEPALPDLSDLEGILAKRAEERAAEEAKKAEQTELEQLRAAKAEWEKAQQAPKLSADLIRQEWAKLSPAERREILQFGTKATLNPDVLSVEQELAALKAELGGKKSETDPDLAKRLEAIEKRQQAEVRAKAEEQYVAAVVDKEKRPLASRLPRAELIERGDYVFNRYHAAGYSLTYEQAGDIVEKELRAQLDLLTGGATQAAEAAEAPDAAKRGTASPQGGPTTLSNDLVADAPASRPLTHEDKLALAERRIAELRAKT